MIAGMSYCGHLIERSTCGDCSPRPAARQVPARSEPAGYGPWFPASYEGECDGCGGDIMPGDRIRADGQGGWLCEECGEENPAPGSDPGCGGFYTVVYTPSGAWSNETGPGSGKTAVEEFMSGAGGPGCQETGG